ncbi:hypothetical protein GGI12_003214 [Dipsacomyces acuminosporus]|nr:hypothetical protein GGI12_003214 [Dipsacomyces acuminosporus]
MHINEVGFDLLHRVFTLVREYDGPHNRLYSRSGARTLASICRSWREINLPYLYRTVYIIFEDNELDTNVRDALNGGYIKYTQILEVEIYNVLIGDIDITALLSGAGIGDTTWPEVAKLCIVFLGECVPVHRSNVLAYDHSAIATTVGYLSKHLPHISDVEFIDEDWDKESVRDYRYLYSFVAELLKTYSAKLTNQHGCQNNLS